MVLTNVSMVGLKNNLVTIDLTHIAEGFTERQLLQKPWWGVVCGVFIFRINGMPVIPIVLRSGHSDYPNQWTIHGAGALDSREELLNPAKGLYREIYEELQLREERATIDPFSRAVQLNMNRVEIWDISVDRTTITMGDVYSTGTQGVFIRFYDSNLDADDMLFLDGERRFDYKLNRSIALVNPYELDNDTIKPIKAFQRRSEIELSVIDLSTRSHTLEYVTRWFAENECV